MQLLPDPPEISARSERQEGAIAQLGERLVCNQKVAGSIPAGSTSSRLLQRHPESHYRVLRTPRASRCSLTIWKFFVLTPMFKR